MSHAWSAEIQSQIRRSLIPGMIIVTCFSLGTDFEMKKSNAAFSKSIITVGEISPAVRTGALALVGSTVASVDMVESLYLWMYARFL